MGLSVRLGSHRVALTDLAVAIVAAALDVALFSQLSDAGDQVGWAGNAPPVVVVLAGLLAIPILVLRRTVPGPACVLLAGWAAALTLVLGSRPLITVLVGLYAAAVWCSRGWALTCLAAVLAAHTLAVAYEASFSGSTPSSFALVAIALVYLLLDLATWAAGRWGASAAARSRTARLEATRAELAREAVEAERLRIARELHDIVAHAITVMVLQSAGAHRLTATQPGIAAEAMQSVETVGKQAIAELRRLLDVLRADGADNREVPTNGALDDRMLSDLETLTRQVEASGVQVQTETSGATGRLDPSVELTAYRVVQEGLTNVAKHGGVGASAVVGLRWGSETLVVEVSNQRATQDQEVEHEASGYGLVGLTERVKLVGGQLDAGPGPENGWRLRAILPTSESAEVG